MLEKSNEMSEELTGIHGLNFSFNNNSSARSVMFSSHFSQRLVIDGANDKVIQTGMEYEMSKYTFDIRMPEDGTILKIIKRYPQRVDKDAIAFSPETLVIYESAQTKEIGSFQLTQFQSYHQYFGFKNNSTGNITKLIPGNFIEKDTLFAASNSVAPNGGFRYGISMNMAFMSHPAVSEDGILISESALKKLEFSVYETRVIEFGDNIRPLNIYGDENNYRCFPEIGEKIKDNGILMVLRKVDPENAPAEQSIYDMMEPDYIFDTAYYVRGPEGKVIDIKVYKDNLASNKIPEQISESLNKYVKGLRSYFYEIIDAEKEIRSERIKKFGFDNTVIKPNLHRQIVEAYSTLDINGSKKHEGKKLNYVYRKSPLKEFRIIFTIEYKIRPTIGFKLTDSAGGKGVICKIEKDENMPIDINGNRAEIVMDSGSTINRMNLGRLYEQYVGSAARDIRKKIIEDLGYTETARHRTVSFVEGLSIQQPSKINETKQFLIGFLRCISDKHADFVQSLSDMDYKEYLTDILFDQLFIFYPIDNPKEPVDVVRSIEKYHPPCFSPVTYVGNSGQRVVTERNVRIGPVYMMLLEKIADDWSAVSYGKTQSSGVLASMTKSEKYTYPFRNNAVRTIGETEGRVFIGYCGQEAVAEMMDRSNSPATQKHMVWNILSANNPGNIPYVINRQIISYGGSKPLSLVNHLFACSGFKVVYEKEDK
jgi:DNA-directed RNA polymerase beta subunit